MAPPAPPAPSQLTPAPTPTPLGSASTNIPARKIKRPSLANVGKAPTSKFTAEHAAKIRAIAAEKKANQTYGTGAPGTVEAKN